MLLTHRHHLRAGDGAQVGVGHTGRGLGFPSWGTFRSWLRRRGKVVGRPASFFQQVTQFPGCDAQSLGQPAE